MTLGEKLQQLRKSRGLSQEHLAAQIAVSRQAISKWELGEAMPDTENVVQLSKIFDVTTDYLLNDDYENDNDSSRIKEMNFEEKQNTYGYKDSDKPKPRESRRGFDYSEPILIALKMLYWPIVIIVYFVWAKWTDYTFSWYSWIIVIVAALVQKALIELLRKRKGEYE